MDKKKSNILYQIFKHLHFIEDSTLVAALFILILLSSSQIVLRNFFATSLLWGDAAARYLILWISLLGAMAATRDNNHITIDIISRFVSPRWNSFVRVITDSATMIITGILTYASVIFIKGELAAGTKAFGYIPAWIAGLIFPVAFFVITVRFAVYLSFHIYEAVTGNIQEYTSEPEGE